MHILLEEIIDIYQEKARKALSKDLQISLSENIQVNFNQLIKDDEELSNIINNLSNNLVKAVIFGGWVRDYTCNYLQQQNYKPRDIDIVVNGLNFNQLQKFLPSNTKINIFGGFLIETSKIKIDIWLLKDTYLIKRLNLDVKFNQLPETTVFRINSIIFKPQQFWSKPDIFDLGCVDALVNKVIDFQSTYIPLPEIQVARALIYSAKFKFSLKLEVHNFIRMICNSDVEITNQKNNLLLYCPQHLRQNCITMLKDITD